MDYITVTKENLEKEHICCAISNNRDVQVASKKEWMKNCFEDGLVFLKSAERGKCFIEYIPAENAWVPIIADGYMYIDCFWVSGAFKGHGYANELLDQCIADSKAKGRAGLCVLSSSKKKPFLSDPGYLLHRGFQIADQSDAGINLLYLPFGESAVAPRFKEEAKHPRVNENGYVLYYTSQCPFNAKYVPIIEALAKQNDVPFHAIHLSSKEQAQAVPSPCTSYALFLNRQFLTHEMLSDKKFLKMIGGEAK
ncbi:MAG: YoaP domain-containing protein [Eubacteriales bacterium]|nr:YoaP domain-containing protein [Eubacteriales bacterium]